jgi:hypothetical protein
VLNAEAVRGLCGTCRYIKLYMYTRAPYHSDNIMEDPNAVGSAVCRLAEDLEDVFANCEIAIAVFVHSGEVESSNVVTAGLCKDSVLLCHRPE